MSTDVTFLQTLVNEKRGELLAEAQSARLAGLARRWRRHRRAPGPPEPASSESGPPDSGRHGPPQQQCRVPAAAR